MSFTVFTPTFNRAATLPRLYQSLLNQSYKDFIWLIIDDGSEDNTKDIVSGWRKENRIKIEYHYKENEGKHTAMNIAYKLARSKYFIPIDSDDELTPDAVEVYKNEWDKIEKDNLESKFAVISALACTPAKKLIGNFYFPKDTGHIDSYWHKMVLKYKNNNELTICLNLEKLKECGKIPEELWLQNKVNFFDECILWARIGRKYQTRYLNIYLCIVHYDANNSLLRIKDINKGHYNNLVNQKYFLDENLDYFFWNPKYFFNLILKFIVSSIELNKSPYGIFKVIKTWRLRLAYILIFPLGLISFIYFKIFKRKFWF